MELYSLDAMFWGRTRLPNSISKTECGLEALVLGAYNLGALAKWRVSVSTSDKLESPNKISISYPEGLSIINVEGKGRGVTTQQRISRGSLVETAVCIPISVEEYYAHIRKTIIDTYLFKGKQGEHLLALGIGSLFNHSDQPNLNYHVDKLSKVITFRAARDIEEDEELTFYYGSNLWFQDVNADSRDRDSCEHEHLDDEKLFLGSINI